MTTVQTKPEVTNDNALEIEKVENPSAGPLTIILGEGIKLESNDVEAADTEEQILMIRQHIRSKVLKQFNVVEVAKTPVGAGRLYFNGNRTSMKLPKVLRDTNDNFMESLEVYFNRVKPLIAIWLKESVQNAAITVEQVTALN